MAWDTYLGYDLFLTEPNYETEPKIGFVTRQTLVSGIGVGFNHATYSENPLRLGYSFLLEDITAIKDTIDFFNDKKGRFNPFFMPSWVRDIKITGAIGPTDRVITVEDTDYMNTWKHNSSLGRHLIIFLEDGTYLCRKIFSAPTTTSLKLGSVLGITRTAAQAQALFCCFLHFVRFDIDELELNYHTLDVAECELTFQTLTVAADGTDSEVVYVTTTTSTTTTSSSSTTSSSTTYSTTTSSSTTTTTTSSSTTTTVDTEGLSVASPYDTWWSGHVVYVGPTGRDFTSIRAAMVAVPSGTIILVDPGSYEFGENFSCAKTLLIRGLGASPTNTVIWNNTNLGWLFYVQSGGRIFLENLTMDQRYNWRHCLTLSGSGSIVANKCYLHDTNQPQYVYPIMAESGWHSGGGTLTLINTYHQYGYSNAHFFGDMYKEQVFMTKVEFDMTLGWAGTGGTSYGADDHVTTPTADYGYNYGTLMITVP